METHTFTLTLPSPPPPAPQGGVQVQSKGAVVILGANGSGKTRLGRWIENNHDPREKVHRISAQKSLEMPVFSTTSSIERARAKLYYGYADGSLDHRDGHRWNSRPHTFLLNDYQSVVEYLFTDDYIVAKEYKESSKVAPGARPPLSKLDNVKRIWEEVITHRELLFRDGKIETQVRGNADATYSAAEMSDGERVIFYLIGQSLLAPENGTIVIDEPELHVHESIQTPLWNKIEAQRPDCLFVYLTHDIDFAASRANAAKICVTGFDGDRWEWYEVPNDADIPEEILLEIVGSRKPIVFVEGDKGSLDYFVYQNVYPSFTIMPTGSCDHVIHATGVFNSLTTLHRLTAHGIIDRDYRNDDEVNYLSGRQIHVLDFSEIENLFLVEDVLHAITDALHRTDFDEIMASIKDEVFDELSKNSEALVTSITAHMIERQLKSLTVNATGESALTTALSDLMSGIKVSDIYAETKQKVEAIIGNREYSEALKFYNNKGLIARANLILKFKSGELIEFSKRLMTSKDSEPLLSAIRKNVPAISS